MALSGSPIVILGSYRSGTSSVSTALVKLSLYMGSEDALFPADEFNPDGHWELNDMMHAHEKILGAFRFNYHATPFLAENWSAMPFVANMVSDLKGLLNKHFAGKANWGWKEPATSILLPLYSRAMQEEGVAPRYLICVRHPRSVVSSMMKRFVQTPMESWSKETKDDLGFEERLMCMWVAYTLSSLKETQGAARQLLCYERYLADPRTYVDRIAQDLIPWQATEEQKAAAAATVKPQLSHANFKPEEGLEGWPSIIAKTYEFCLRADKDPQAFTQGSFDQEIDVLWTEWLRWRRMIQPPTLPVSQLQITWNLPSGSGQVYERYAPTGGWQIVKCAMAVPSEGVVQVDPYHAPCRIWIKSATWHSGEQRLAAELQQGPGGLLDDVPGMKRLSIFGPSSLLVKLPAASGTWDLELEMLVHCNEAMLAGMVSALGARLAKS